jgi:hypothetical protein
VISSPGVIALIARRITLRFQTALSALGRQEWLA